MEENEIVEPVEQTETEENKIEWEVSPYNRNDRFIPTEYHYDIDFKKSWKQCHCGRKTWFNDNFCPACGQRLGKPEIVDDDRKE
jgi:hypothetical protein